MSKKTYRVRNWRYYNEALVKRGRITLWFTKKSLKNWPGEKREGKRGRPQKYSDVAIVCGLTIKVLFKLTFRMTEGFIKDLMEMLQMRQEVPDYTLLCKRQKSVSVALPKRPASRDEGIHVVVDTTGLKVFGEGEWKVRQHGWLKHRLWRKLHVALNSENQLIEAYELTDLGVQDSEGFKPLVDAVEGRIDSVIGDGAYDQFACYEKGEERGFKLVAPPQRNARTSEERPRNRKKASVEAVRKRDEAVMQIRQLGRKEWKEEVGYYRRCLAETAMFRMKTLLGNHLSTRTLKHQKTEVAIRCSILNQFTLLGMPQTVEI